MSEQLCAACDERVAVTQVVWYKRDAPLKPKNIVARHNLCRECIERSEDVNKLLASCVKQETIRRRQAVRPAVQLGFVGV